MPETLALRKQVHEFYASSPTALTLHAARSLNVPEAEVVRHLPGDRSVELNAARFEELLRSFEPVGDVHVIVTNAAATLETLGRFGGLSGGGGYFNVQSPTLDMHIRREQIGSIFAVQKPSHMDGGTTLSVQFFDREGRSAFKVFFAFGGSAPATERVEAFDRVIREFRAA